MKMEIPADYFYKGSPAETWEVTRESIDRAIDNARKVFGPDFMVDVVTESEQKKPKQ